MKKIYFILIIFSFNIDLKAQGDFLLNPGFESWTDTLPDQWGLGDFCRMSTDAHSGDYSLHWTVNHDMDTPYLNGGAFVFQRYRAIGFWIKGVLMDGDYYGMEISFYDTSGNAIGYAQAFVPTVTNTWTQVVTDITYIDSTSIPFACTINMSIYSFTHQGSEIFLDDFEISNVVTIDDKYLPISFNVWPNPASQKLNIYSSEPISSVMFTDLSGRVINKFISESENRIDISDISPGLYWLKVVSQKGTGYKKVVID